MPIGVDMRVVADDVRVDRRAGLKGLLVVVVCLAGMFGVAWYFLGRSARYESLKGAFLAVDLPAAFTEVDENGTGSHIGMLGEAPELKRVFAVSLPHGKACTRLGRAFRQGGGVQFTRVTPLGAHDCGFSGSIGEFSFDAELRTTPNYVKSLGDEEGPALPTGTRSVLTMIVEE